MSTTASRAGPLSSPPARAVLALVLSSVALARASGPPTPESGTVQAIEISQTQVGLLPQGQEADGIIGDPIFVDVDGDGFTSNGDTLGHPLLVTPAFRQRY